MSSMENILLILVCLLGGSETEALSVTGVIGGQITIKCSHTFAFSNTKYFCKEPCRSEDILISSRTTISNQRYSIKDKGNSFDVTITDLRKDDTGTYWCAIDRTGLDTYNKVNLRMTDGNTKEPDDAMSQSHSTEQILNNSLSPTVKLMELRVSLGVLMLALALVFLIFIRQRKKHTSKSPEKDHNVAYATQSNQKRDAHCDITMSSSTANENQETRTNLVTHHQDTSRDLTNKSYANMISLQGSHFSCKNFLYS
ncbi:hypothetical protein LDENG_00085350 [Lucifuga dentata]|nr:hypothetical protein LDENG_00085350 [Lucifuga dentata]